MRLNPAPVGTLTLLVAADVQDNLLMVFNDLERLRTLLSGACDTLLAGFSGANRALHAPAAHEPAVGEAIEHLGAAVVALQFQDMAAQLIDHTQRRLRHCTDRLAFEAFGDDGDAAVIEPLPSSPNPVTQDEMDAGSITLF
ncbi:MAG: hypothetical protein ABIZ18_00990 [Caldimonas sp.]